jgi:16S rRNA A1518/A1519 N6-dimethyltransferase RsmA/KsgA/DIM1 with predicted DNA glycosylase/AP lyase activity
MRSCSTYISAIEHRAHGLQNITSKVMKSLYKQTKDTDRIHVMQGDEYCEYLFFKEACKTRLQSEVNNETIAKQKDYFF